MTVPSTHTQKLHMTVTVKGLNAASTPTGHSQFIIVQNSAVSATTIMVLSVIAIMTALWILTIVTTVILPSTYLTE